MKKLSLSLEELSVESFMTTRAPAGAGTVRGQDISDTTCNQIRCDCPTGSGATCGDTCGETCNDDSCEGTCRLSCGCGTTGISDCVHPLSACGACTEGGNCPYDTEFCLTP